jgi:hypothetical protein
VTAIDLGTLGGAFSKAEHVQYQAPGAATGPTPYRP